MFKEIIVSAQHSLNDVIAKVYVILIDPVSASNILGTFNATIPLEIYNLSHLKRMKPTFSMVDGVEVKKLSIIVCPADQFENAPCAIQELCADKQLVDVCGIEPQTKLDFDEWSKYWPMNFHTSHLEKEREKGFSEAELGIMRNAVRHLQEDEERNLAIRGNGKLEGAVIVNPQNGCLVTTSSASLSRMATKLHPDQSECSHASMSSRFAAVAGHPLYTPTMLCVDGVAAIVRGEVDGEGSLPDNFYLCSGLDLYVSIEPDLMSSMALVHSRIRRVFFRSADGEFGALESGHGHIHSLKALNHHYRVFKIGS